MPNKVGDLEISQDLKVEQRQWRVERVSRVVLVLLVVAALLGLFGPGPLSWSRAEDGALSTEYQRFGRSVGS